jgi:hypothetical protein
MPPKTHRLARAHEINVVILTASWPASGKM